MVNAGFTLNLKEVQWTYLGAPKNSLFTPIRQPSLPFQKPEVIIKQTQVKEVTAMRRGQTITEYLFLLSLIAIGAILALTVFGNGVGFRYANILSRLPFP